MKPSASDGERELECNEIAVYGHRRAGHALEKAGQMRNAAITSIIGGMVVAVLCSLFSLDYISEVVIYIRIATILIGMYLFVKANGEEIKAGRYLQGGDQMNKGMDIGPFNWLIWRK